MTTNISAVILTKNEEHNIVDCLEQLSFCNEIIVIDDKSEDRTMEVARSKKAIVISHPLESFSKSRNLGLEKAKNDWILFIDADEKVSKALEKEILTVVRNPYLFYTYQMKRTDHMFGKELLHGETGSVRLVRLVQKDSGKWVGDVHERFETSKKVGILKNSLHHYPHPKVAEFLSEINYYSDLRAKELYKKRVKASLWTIILYPLGKFIVNFIFKRGFLDGTPGFIVAFMMSFHSFLVRSKLWLLYNKKEHFVSTQWE